MSPTANYVLYASKAEITRHWRSLSARLSTILSKDGGKYWIEDSSVSGIDGNLRCGNYMHEKALRERGADVPIVPLSIARTREIRYWISLYQSWREPRSSRKKSFLYHTTGITVFCGKEYEEKIQLFRAEWPGLREMRDGSVEFEASGAGHPHWQFDAYQHHLHERQQEQYRHDALIDLLDEKEPEAKNFTDEVFTGPSSDKEYELTTHMQQLTRVHFASSTRWTENLWSGELSDVNLHAQAPASLNELINWIVSTISYIQQETSR